MFVFEFLCGHIFSFNLGIYHPYIRRTAGSYGSSMFNFLRNCQTIFQKNCIIWELNLNFLVNLYSWEDSLNLELFRLSIKK